MAPSIQELNTPNNPIWDFFSNPRDGHEPSAGEQPPWASFFRGGPGWGHGPLPNRGMPPHFTPHPEGGRPPPYPRPFESENEKKTGEGHETTPATEAGPEKEKADHPMDEEADEQSDPASEHDRRHRHGHRHGSRGRGCGPRGGFGGRGRGHHGHGHGYGHHGRGFGGWGGAQGQNWQSMLSEMARAGMGPLADYYKQTNPNHPFAQWAGAAGMGSQPQEFTPSVDVFDTPDAYEIHVSVPGAKKENIAVTYSAEESTVNISGIVERLGDSEFQEYMAMSERQVGAFERKVRLGTRTEPAAVDDAHIGAKLEDGVLKVHVPKILKEDEYVEVRKVDIE